MKVILVALHEWWEFETVEEFKSWASKLEYDGDVEQHTAGVMLRDELIGKPKFRELAGPMYDGPDRIRYETWGAYRAYSN